MSGDQTNAGNVLIVGKIDGQPGDMKPIFRHYWWIALITASLGTLWHLTAPHIRAVWGEEIEQDTNSHYGLTIDKLRESAKS